jgi:hypothetical protein
LETSPLPNQTIVAKAMINAIFTLALIIFLDAKFFILNLCGCSYGLCNAIDSDYFYNPIDQFSIWLYSIYALIIDLLKNNLKNSCFSLN